MRSQSGNGQHLGRDRCRDGGGGGDAVVGRIGIYIFAGQRHVIQRHCLARTNIFGIKGRAGIGHAHHVTADQSAQTAGVADSRSQAAVISFIRRSKAVERQCFGVDRQRAIAAT